MAKFVSRCAHDQPQRFIRRIALAAAGVWQRRTNLAAAASHDRRAIASQQPAAAASHVRSSRVRIEIAKHASGSRPKGEREQREERRRTRTRRRAEEREAEERRSKGKEVIRRGEMCPCDPRSRHQRSERSDSQLAKRWTRRCSSGPMIIFGAPLSVVPRV